MELKHENFITREDFLGVSKRIHYNGFIADFYKKMALEFSSSDFGEDPNFVRRAEKLKECSKVWVFDHYKKSGFKNLVRLNRCTDRFCLNCQALEADQRFLQYSPILDSFSKDYDLYHVVLTVPNVDAEHLTNTVTLMLDRFSYLIRFFDGRKKIRGVDFFRYGYVGAVRSLEITVSKKNGSFHPHLHCIFILRKDMNLSHVYFNSFSVDKTGRKDVYLFSELELLIQRIWALLILKVKVTKDNIERIGEVTGYPDGFSCRAELSNGAYHEIFKYAIKGTFKNETLFSYDAFKTLYRALYNRRVYQTFGVLLKWDFNEVDEDLGIRDSLDEIFDEFLSKLNAQEIPVMIEENISKILKVKKEDWKYISRATFVAHFKSLSDEDKAKTLDLFVQALEDKK